MGIYVLMYIYIHIYTYIDIYRYTHIYTYVCISTHIHIYVYASTHMYMYIHGSFSEVGYHFLGGKLKPKVKTLNKITENIPNKSRIHVHM